MKPLWLALLFLVALAGRAPASEFLSKVGDALPAAIAEAIKRTEPSFDARGNVLLVTFIDCSSQRCEEMLPAIQEYVAKPLQDRLFRAVAIAVKSGTDQSAAMRRSTGVDFPIVPDSDGQLFGLFATNGVPRTLIYDGNGRLAYQHAGFRSGREAEFRKVAELLLDGQPIPAETASRSRTVRQSTPALGDVDPRLHAVSIVGQQGPQVPVEAWVVSPPERKADQYLLVDFWATWCGPCIVALDAAEKIHHEFESQLVTWAISDEPVATVEAYAKRKGWKQPIGVDTQARAKQQLKVRGIPHAYIEAPGGEVIWQGHPMELWMNNGERLRKLLAAGRTE